MKNIILATAMLMGLASITFGQGATGIDMTKGLYFNQNLGTQIPLDLPFKDDAGKDVKIGDYFNKGKPVILVFVFYNCQSSCLLIRDGLLTTLNSQKQLRVGRDVDVVVVSINPKEKPELAKSMKDMYMANYRYPEGAEGWHLLTGTKESIYKLTQAIGFGFTIKEVQNPETKELSDQIAHPSGIIILTPTGETSLYLLGVTYPAEMVFKGVKAAEANKVGQKTETILFGCFMYDTRTGKYRVVVENLLKVSGIATLLILVSSIAVMSVKNKRMPLYREGKGGTPTAP